MNKTLMTFLGALGAVIFLLFVAPLISFGLSYLIGIIIKVTIGKWIIVGLNLLGLDISLNDIPLLAGTLGWIGSYFKNTNIKVNKD